MTAAPLVLLSSPSAPQTAPNTPSLNSRTSPGRAARPYTPVPQRTFVNDGKHRIIVSNRSGHALRGFRRAHPFDPTPLQRRARPGAGDRISPNVAQRTRPSASSTPRRPIQRILRSRRRRSSRATAASTRRISGRPCSAMRRSTPGGLLEQFFGLNSNRVDIGLPVPDVEQLLPRQRQADGEPGDDAERDATDGRSNNPRSDRPENEPLCRQQTPAFPSIL